MADVPQADPNGLMHIGAVAAHNIAAALGLPVEQVGTIEQAIKDEIGVMSSTFTLDIAEVATQHEIAVMKLAKEKDEFIAAAKVREAQAIAAFQAKVAEIKSTFDWLNENKGRVVVAGLSVFSVGAFVGTVIGKLIGA